MEAVEGTKGLFWLATSVDIIQYSRGSIVSAQAQGGGSSCTDSVWGLGDEVKFKEELLGSFPWNIGMCF